MQQQLPTLSSSFVATEWVNKYIAQGFQPVHWPLSAYLINNKRGYKGPRGQAWPTTEYGPIPDNVLGFYQVGLKLGTLIAPKIENGPTGYLVCVDIEDKNTDVQRLAETLLPPTGMIGGRADKPRSHRFYLTDKPMTSFSWLGVRTDGQGAPGDTTTVLEILSVTTKGAVGSQVVVTPSAHLEANCNYVWDSFAEAGSTPGGATVLTCEDLFKACEAIMVSIPGASLSKGRDLPPAWEEKAPARGRSARVDREFIATQGLLNDLSREGSNAYTPSETVQKSREMSDNEAATLISETATRISQLKDGEHNVGLNLQVFTAASLLEGGSRPEDDFQTLFDESIKACESGEVAQRFGETAVDLRKCADTIQRAIRDGRNKPRVRAGLRKYALTAHGLADLLTDEWGDHYRWVWEWQRWIRWDGQVWAPVPCEEHIQRAMVTVLRWAQFEAMKMKKAGASGGDKGAAEWAEAAAEWYYRCESGDATAKAARHIRDEHITRQGLGISVEELDANPLLLAVQNGVYDFSTGALRDFSRLDMITRQSPYRYNPQARCPKWEAQLRWAFEKHPDADAVYDYFARWLGYASTGYVREQAILVAAGDGANGKSTILNTAVEVLGPRYAAYASPYVMVRIQNQTKNQDELLVLEGTRLGLVSEPEKGQFFTEGLLKRLTEPVIRFKVMYEAEREMRMTASLILDTNHIPRVVGMDWGIFRRLKIIPFTNKVTEDQKVAGLQEMLVEEEGDGILTWILQEGTKYIREGLAPEPRSVDVALQAYRDKLDTVRGFVRDKCIVYTDATHKAIESMERWKADPTPEHKAQADRWATIVGDNSYQSRREWAVGASALYEAYVAHVRGNGGYPQSNNNFGGQMRRLISEADTFMIGEAINESDKALEAPEALDALAKVASLPLAGEEAGDTQGAAQAAANAIQPKVLPLLAGVRVQRVRSGMVYSGLKLKEYEDPVALWLSEGGEEVDLKDPQRGDFEGA